MTTSGIWTPLTIDRSESHKTQMCQENERVHKDVPPFSVFTTVCLFVFAFLWLSVYWAKVREIRNTRVTLWRPGRAPGWVCIPTGVCQKVRVGEWANGNRLCTIPREPGQWSDHSMFKRKKKSSYWRIGISLWKNKNFCNWYYIFF